MLDEVIDQTIRPVADLLGDAVFFEVTVLGSTFPLIVVWLVSAALFFTCYFRFINIWGIKHALHLVFRSRPTGSGELSHFQALATALSGTVGIGNIGGMAIVISLGGPGAIFWLVVAGFLGMATKFVECVGGVTYRQVHADGTVSGGPMHYLKHGLAELGLPNLGKLLGYGYALAMVIGCLGIGNMFQSNQAYRQFLVATGDLTSPFQGMGWLFGSIMAAIVALVIVGGLRRIAQITSRLVPIMAVAYIVLAITVIAINGDKVPGAIAAIFEGAFTPTAAAGGVLGVIMLGFKRAVFSNEAGIGSAAIAHAAVKTEHPVTEGFVGLLEPFIDTVVICTITSLVILTTLYEPGQAMELQGIELTARSFASTFSWSPTPLAIIAILFAFSTMISWSYYGLKGWTFLVGKSRKKEVVFQIVFCVFVALGCAVELDAVLDFSDAMVFLVSIPNLIGLYLLAPRIKKQLRAYRNSLTAQEG